MNNPNPPSSRLIIKSIHKTKAIPKPIGPIGSRADNKITLATITHPPHPITFKHEGVLYEKSTNSNNVLGWSLLPNQPKKLPGGQQDQGHEVVHHD